MQSVLCSTKLSFDMIEQTKWNQVRYHSGNLSLTVNISECVHLSCDKFIHIVSVFDQFRGIRIQYENVKVPIGHWRRSVERTDSHKTILLTLWWLIRRMRMYICLGLITMQPFIKLICNKCIFCKYHPHITINGWRVKRWTGGRNGSYHQHMLL